MQFMQSLATLNRVLARAQSASVKDKDKNLAYCP